MIKYILLIVCTGFLGCNNQVNVTSKNRAAVLETAAAIRDAFGRRDVEAIMQLHHPDVMKFFGGNNVVRGHTALRKGLNEMFAASAMEFIDNQLENLIVEDDVAVETSVFTIRSIPNNVGDTVISRGRAMVVYIRYANSPTGWVSLREMAQEAPPVSQ